MSDTTAGLLQIGALLAALAVCYRPLGRLPGARLHQPSRTCASSASSTASSGSTPTPTSAGRSTRRPCSRSRSSGVAAALRPPAAAVRTCRCPSASPRVDPALAFNTAVSFVTNTNWQSYSGEATMGHLVQMAGLAVQNFVSAAVGIAVAVALDPRLRAVPHATGSATSGSTWSASCVRVLLPLAVVAAVVLIAMGVVQNFAAGTDVTTLAGGSRPSPAGRSPRRRRSRSSAPTAAASTTPTPRTRSRTRTRSATCFEIFLLLLIPVALTRTFGRMVGDKRQGYAILGAMARPVGRSLVAAVTVARGGRTRHRPAGSPAARWRARRPASASAASALFAASTTGTSTGAVELVARLVHGARWRRADLQHGARRGRAGRRRLRALRDARARRSSRCSSPG